MHSIAQTLNTVVSPLTHIATLLASKFTSLACGVPLGSFGLATIVVASIVFAAICGLRATSERMRSNRHRERLVGTLRRLQTGIHLRDALLESFSEAVVVLKCSPEESLSCAGGRKLLQHCLTGPDATRLAARVNDLLTRGTGFELAVRTIALREMVVRGQLIGDRAVLFLRDPTAAGHKSSAATSTPSQPKAQEMRVRALAGAPGIEPLFGHDFVRLQPSNDMASTTEDTEEGVVRIDSDGHAKQYNQAFADQWSLSDDLLRRAPQLSEIAKACLASKGRDAIWDVVASAIHSAEPERLNNWGTLIRGDGRPVLLNLSRLADGSTLVKFAEIPAAVAALPAPLKEMVA